jgi:DNA polymerase-1
MLALVDGDLVCWMAGASSQKTLYSMDGVQFEKLSEAKEYCDSVRGSWAEIETEFVAEPVANALNNAKLILKNISEQEWYEDVRTYFSSSVSQFRKDEISSYKANRSIPKPVHFEEIRAYLDKYWGGEEAPPGYEADDWLGLNQTTDTVICTLDKDLRMVPGWHYNWRTQQLSHVNPEEGFRFFLQQMITGDSVDNIPGIPDAGIEYAKEYMRGKDNAYLLRSVGDLYEAEFGEEGMYRFYETARQLWIHHRL